MEESKSNYDESKIKDSSTSSSMFSSKILSNEEIESRRSSYLQFINSITRVCSPTICGTLNYQTSNSNNEILPFKYKEASNACINSKKINNFEEFDNFDNKFANDFDWSIDQIALLNPCEFTLNEDIQMYKEFEEFNNSKLIKENDEFFKQDYIVPSPIVNTPNLIPQNDLKITKSIPLLNKFKTPLRLKGIKYLTPQKFNCNDKFTPSREKFVSKKKLFDKYDSPSQQDKITNSSLTNSYKTFISPHSSYFNFNQSVNTIHNCTELIDKKLEISLDISAIKEKDENDFSMNDSNIKSDIILQPNEELIKNFDNKNKDILKDISMKSVSFMEFSKMDIDMEESSIENTNTQSEKKDNSVLKKKLFLNNVSMMETSKNTIDEIDVNYFKNKKEINLLDIQKKKFKFKNLTSTPS